MNQEKIEKIVKVFKLKNGAQKTLTEAAKSGFLHYTKLIHIIPQKLKQDKEKRDLLFKGLNSQGIKITKSTSLCYNPKNDKDNNVSQSRVNLKKILRNEIADFPYLSKKEEAEIGQRMLEIKKKEEKDEKFKENEEFIELRNKLVSHHLILAWKIATKNFSFLAKFHQFDSLDAFQESCKALLKCAERFDPQKARFKTFADFRAKGIIIDELVRKASAVNASTCIIRNASRVLCFIEEFDLDNDHDYDYEHCLEKTAEEFDLSKNMVKETLAFLKINQKISLNHSNSYPDDDFNLFQIVPDNNLTPLQILEAKEELKATYQEIKKVLDEVFRIAKKGGKGEKKKIIFLLRYGHLDEDGEPELTLKEVGRLCRTSESRACQIISEVWQSIKHIKMAPRTADKWMIAQLKKLKTLEKLCQK